MRASRSLCAAAIVGLALVGSEASAQPYNGRWARHPGACDGEAFTKPETPLLVERLSIRWFDTDCTVVSSYRVKDTWFLQGRCTAEGRTNTIPLMLELQGDRLRVGWNRDTVTEMQRCR